MMSPRVAGNILIAALALLLVMPTIACTQPVSRSSIEDSRTLTNHVAEDIPPTPVEPEIHHTYGDAGYQVGVSITEVSDGGFALLGYTRVSDTTDYDIWLIRTDLSGNVLWDRTYDRASRDFGTRIIESSGGGFAILGTTQGDEVPIDRVTWLVRTDAQGEMLWDQVYDVPGQAADEAYALVELDDGGFAFAGRSRAPSLGDVWVVRTDSLGEEIWSRTHGGTKTEAGFGMVLADDGDLVKAGSTTSYGEGSNDAWLLKIDVETGDEVWAKTIGDSESNVARSITKGSNGDFILSGSTGLGGGAGSIWLVRTNQDGNVIWDHEYTVEGGGHNTAVSVIETSRGDLAVTGYVGDNLLWLRTDSEGTLVEVTVFGGGSRDVGAQVIEFAPDSFAIFGYTRSFGVALKEDFWLVLISTPKRPLLKLSGEFDFLLKEDIHLQIAALLTDKNTGEPISDATVTFTVYDPDLNPFMLGPLVEEIPDSGVYENTSRLTMKDMKLPKGIYLVYAHAVTWDGYEAIDMIQFHIDPPASMDSGLLVPTGIGVVAVFAIGLVGVSLLGRKARARKHSS
jgi:hypothetical protein